MDTKTFVENEIFSLRQKAADYLRAGNTEKFNSVQIIIAALQAHHGVTSGHERKPSQPERHVRSNAEETLCEPDQMRTEAYDRATAEEEVFSLRKRIGLYVLAGDSGEVSRLQLAISQLQQTFGAVTGIERKVHAQGNEPGSGPD